jgi:hypothetical protein
MSFNAQSFEGKAIWKVFHLRNWSCVFHLMMCLKSSNPRIQMLSPICHNLTHKIKTWIIKFCFPWNHQQLWSSKQQSKTQMKVCARWQGLKLIWNMLLMNDQDVVYICSSEAHDQPFFLLASLDSDSAIFTWKILLSSLQHQCMCLWEVSKLLHMWKWYSEHKGW